MPFFIEMSIGRSKLYPLYMISSVGRQSEGRQTEGRQNLVVTHFSPIRLLLATTYPKRFN